MKTLSISRYASRDMDIFDTGETNIDPVRDLEVQVLSSSMLLSWPRKLLVVSETYS